jgi:hypothetical protein
MIVPAETKVKAEPQAFLWRSAAQRGFSTWLAGRRCVVEVRCRMYCVASNLTGDAPGLTRMQKSIDPRFHF